MKLMNKNTFIGYAAGIITGVSYGFNPLFGLPLMQAGSPIEVILFFRYALSVILLGIFIFSQKESFKINLKQASVLFILGLLYTASSIFLFESYKYIPSGLATTIIFLYPVFVAIIMIFLRVFPSWQVWLSVILTFIGVFIMTKSDSTQQIRWEGVLLAIGSALVYALFIVIINRNKSISKISTTVLTFYSLLVGSMVFLSLIFIKGYELTQGLSGGIAWLNILGLAILPTIISTTTLALSTRKIGATKASVLGVFEPITAVLIGTLAFGEILTQNMVIGILLSILAIVFMVVSKKE